MFRKNKLFFWTSEILLLTIIFYLWREMGAIITPFVSVANTIMIPFLLGGFLYYLTNPIVNFLQKYFKINRIIGILLTLCALVWGLVIGVVYLLPILVNLQSFARFDCGFIYLSSLSKFRYSSDYSTVKSLLCRYSTKYPK